MWSQIERVYSEERQSNSKNSGGRKKRNNYNNTLKELGQMLPIPLRSSCKKLTKKEILLGVLRYIEHLQSSINTARALLRVQCEDPKEGSEKAVKRGPKEGTPRAKKAKPSGALKKPRKRKRPRKAGERGSERRGANKRVCKCLSLETGKGHSRTGGEETFPGAGDAASSVLLVSQKPLFPTFHLPAPETYQQGSAAFLDVAEDWNFSGDNDESVFSACVAQVAYEELQPFSGEIGDALFEQELVHYYSCEEGEEEGSGTSPWLSTQSPSGISSGKMQPSSSGNGGQMETFSDLGLSPSLFSSPTRLLPTHVLQCSQEELSPELFEDLYLSPQWSNTSGTRLRKSAFTLDHCYLSYSERGKSDSSPISRRNPTSSSWMKPFPKEEETAIKMECPASSSDENGDNVWMPCKEEEAPPQVPCPKKKKKVSRRQKQKRRPIVCEKRSSAAPLQLKKKCVNGFIMFCRMNRKHYIRACPGMASTAATRELAQLWRMMTKQERKPYCTKARRFSRLNNRIVRDDLSSGEEESEPPKPFHLLLAEKSLSDSKNFSNLNLLDFLP